MELAATASDPNDMLDKPRWKLQVLLGTQRQHAGGWHGDVLANKIREILLDKCPDAFGRDVCDKKITAWGPVGYTSVKECILGPVRREFYRDDANLVLEIYSSYFPADNPGLRDLFINHVAEVFGSTSDLKVNQYEVKLVNAGSHSCADKRSWNRFANAPDRVEISLSPPPYEDLDTNPHLYVRLSLNRNAVEGKFDCVGSVKAADEVAPPGRIAAYSRLINRPVWGWTYCPTREVSGDCKWYNPPSFKFCDPW